MLDRLPLELALDIVHYEPSPWARADLFNCLCGLTRRYRYSFLPYRQPYLVIQSPCALRAVQLWSETQRRIVKTVLARSSPSAHRQVADAFGDRRGKTNHDAEGIRFDSQALPSDEHGSASVSLADVVAIMYLLPAVHTFYASEFGEVELNSPGEALDIEISQDSPFNRCRTIIITDTPTWWTQSSTSPAALQHLTVRHASATSPPGLDGIFQNLAFRNLRTLRLGCRDLPYIPVASLNQLEAIQIDHPSRMSVVPFLYFATETPVLFNL